MMNGTELFQQGLGIGTFSASVLLLMVWSLLWKGLALWHSAKRKQPWWFVVMLIVNTMGILEIVYLFAIAKIKRDQLFK